MNEKKLAFLYSPSKKILVAATPHGSEAIGFNQEENKWYITPRNYHQMMDDSIYDGDDWEDITPEKAKIIYKDIYPDEELFKGDFYGGL